MAQKKSGIKIGPKEVWLPKRSAPLKRKQVLCTGTRRKMS